MQLELINVYVIQFPSEALAYQLTGIILASLNDIEKTGETPRNVRQETANFSFKKFPEHSDDIIIATPIEFYKLLEQKNIDPAFDYVIFDEFHNITDNKLASVFSVSAMACRRVKIDKIVAKLEQKKRKH